MAHKRIERQRSDPLATVDFSCITNQHDLMAMLPSHDIGIDDGGSYQRASDIQRSGSDVRRRKSMKSMRRKPNDGYFSVRQHQRRPDEFEMEIIGREVDKVDDEGDGTDSIDSVEDEEQIWRRTQTIKDIPASLKTKRQFRSQLMSAPSRKLEGVAAVRYRNNRKWQYFKSDARDVFSKLVVWRDSFKEIEGAFGMGVSSYFRFLKWLLFLNVYIALIMILVILVPQVVLKPHDFVESIKITTVQISTPSTVNQTNATTAVPEAGALLSRNISYIEKAIQCSRDYKEFINNQTNSSPVVDKVLDFLKGTGWLDRTILFYGYYFNKTYVDTVNENVTTVYNMPLAYLLSTGAYFIISLILLVRVTGSGVTKSVVLEEEHYFKYSNMVFSSWDYCMTDKNLAEEKKRKNYREFEMDMESQRLTETRKNRTFSEKIKLVVIRIFINVIVVGILSAAGFLIFYVNDQSLQLLRSDLSSEGVKLIVEYMPAGVIMILNFVVPMLFDSIVRLEDFSPEGEIRITLARTVFLRLASLAVLIASLYQQITNCTDRQCGNCSGLKCWETYVGQSFYKLVLLDFAVQFFVTIVSFLRFFIVRTFEKKSKIIKWIGREQFDIPKNVLDIVYAQVLCWIGGFYCILIPAITVVKLFILFYLRKAVVMRTCESSARTYKASKSYRFFLYILLISYMLTIIPVGYSIGQIPPSQSCGAFRVYSYNSYTMFDTIQDTINTWPAFFRNVFYFLGAPHFYVPLIILLCLLIYYYYAVSAGKKRMIELLKEELVMEGKDKQFLLNRMKEVLFQSNT